MIRSLLRGIFRSVMWVCTAVGFVLIGSGLLLYFCVLDHIEPPPKPLTHDAILTVALNGTYEDHQGSIPGLMALVEGKATSLYDLTRAIIRAATDKKVVGLVIRIETPSLGIAQIQEIRDAILTFKKTGKPTWCCAESFGELSSGTELYYLATACDHIILQPLGMLSLTGVSKEVPFAKGTLDKLGVTSNLIQKKEYKSFEETFTREDFSASAREAEQAIVDSFLGQIVEGIALDRKIPQEHVRALIDKGPYLLETAKSAGLIDSADFYDSLLEQLRKKFGPSVGYMGITQYLKTLPLPSAGGKIALIFGAGRIQRGRGTLLEKSVIEPNSIEIAFTDAMEDPDVKGIVFSIDSPGGSPLAAEAIRYKIELLQARYKKPVIVSMGGVAASGGYWIALPASKLVAHPATLTGSIGAMGGKFVLAGLFDQLGIHWDRVSTGENGTMWSFVQPYTPLQQTQIDAWIQQIYDAFIVRVAKSRHMTNEQVERIAKGRVWTGEQALALGLVDSLGGIHTAITLAKKEVGLPQEASVIIFPRPRTLLEEVMDLFEKKTGEPTYIPPRLGVVAGTLRFFRQLGGLFPNSEAVVYAPVGERR